MCVCVCVCVCDERIDSNSGDSKNTLLTPSMIPKQKIETNKKLKNSHLKKQISNHDFTTSIKSKGA